MPTEPASPHASSASRASRSSVAPLRRQRSTQRTDPSQLVRWFGPDGGPVVSAEADVRVGGQYRIVFCTEDGEEHNVGGLSREVVPGEASSSPGCGAPCRSACRRNGPPEARRRGDAADADPRAILRRAGAPIATARAGRARSTSSSGCSPDGPAARRRRSAAPPRDCARHLVCATWRGAPPPPRWAP